MKISVKSILLGSLLLWSGLFALHGQAAGLGKLTVLSNLGQPLRAEIDLVSVSKEEADTLVARLGSQATFQQAGIELPPLLQSLRFAVDHRTSGSYFIRLTSTQPINEPFLDILVELSWAAGRLVREYTLLLDPPGFTSPAPATAAPVSPAVIAPKTEPVPAQPVQPVLSAPQTPSPQSAPEQGAKPEPAAEKALEPKPLETQPLEAKPAAAAPTKTDDSYQVKRGDTLHKIASEQKTEGVSLEQMMVSIFRNNRGAFDGGNMNRLKTGKVLSLPDPQGAAQIQPKEARKVISAQTAEWNAYRNKLAAAAADAPVKTEAGSQTASGKVTAKVEDKTPAAENKDQLKLSKAEGAEKGAAAGVAKAKAAADDAAAREKQLSESNSRVAELEKNIQEMKKILEMKNQSLANIQKQADAPKDTPLGAAKSADAKPADVKPADPKAADTKVVPAPAAANSAEAVKNDKPADAAKPVEPPKAVAKAAAPKKLVIAPPPPPEASFVDELLDNLLYLAGAVAVLVVGVGGAIWYRRKKKNGQFQDSVISAGGLTANSVFGSTGGATVDTAHSTFSSSMDKASVDSMESDEVDPISEADIYIAYGRDAQAEEILKESLQKTPARLPLYAKLCEIYSARKDAKSFNAIAGELQRQSNGDGPEWKKVVSMGVQLDPSNVWYTASSGAPAPVDSSPTAVIPSAPMAAMAAQVDAAQQTQIVPPDTAPAVPDVDFNLDMMSTQITPPQADIQLDVAMESTPLSFDLDLGAAAPADSQSFSPEGTVIINTNTPEGTTSGIMDFDLGLDAPVAAETVQVPAAAPASDGMDFDFNLDTSASPAADVAVAANGNGNPMSPAEEEAATKLDLAQAYEEMGDKDGARELLAEVMKEGNEAQKTQAQEVLGRLG